MKHSYTKHLEIQGVTLYYVNDELLRTALENINAVVLLASTEDLFTPVFYQRYCDYIDKRSLDRLELVECLQPYVIDRTKYPTSYAYALLHSKLDLTSTSAEDYLDVIDNTSID